MAQVNKSDFKLIIANERFKLNSLPLRGCRYATSEFSLNLSFCQIAPKDKQAARFEHLIGTAELAKRFQLWVYCKLEFIPVCLAKAPGRGYPFLMPQEPAEKRTVAFFDGQNFFRCAQFAFNLSYPNFDPVLLAQKVCHEQGWKLSEVRFYTGLPDATKDPHWNYFWTQKLRVLGRKQNVQVITRPLRYRTKEVDLPDGTKETVEFAVEKGIDVRLALDVVKLGWRHEYDVALIFSQDQDLCEVVEDITSYAKTENRWIRIASAFPSATGYSNRRGIARTDWIRIDQTFYDACIDPGDYRPMKKLKTFRGAGTP